MDVLQGGFGSVGVPSSDLETKIETIFNGFLVAGQKIQLPQPFFWEFWMDD